MNQKQIETLTALYKMWLENPVQATLWARMNYKMIDQDMVYYVGQMARQAFGRLQVSQDVDVLAQGFGLAPGQDSGLGSSAYSIQTFYEMLRAVFQYNGDPPVSEVLRAKALNILQGRIPASEGVRAAGSDAPFLGDHYQAVLNYFGVMEPGIESMLALAGFLAAAMALPRRQLRKLFGQPAKPPPATARELYDLTMEKVRALGESNREEAEKLLLKALDLASKSTEPYDDIEALRQLLLISDHIKLKPDTVRQCVKRVTALVKNGTRGDALGQIVAILGPMATAKELSGELGKPLAEAGNTLLKGRLSHEVRFDLSEVTADGWRRTGRSDLAFQVLKEVEELKLNPTEKLKIKRVEADLYWDSGDREGAADLLEKALKRKGKVDPVERQITIQKLISLWPEERKGLEKWLDEYTAQLKGMQEPALTIMRLSLVFALKKAGQVDLALKTGRSINIGELREKLPADYSSWIDNIESQLSQTLKDLEEAQT